MERIVNGFVHSLAVSGDNNGFWAVLSYYLRMDLLDRVTDVIHRHQLIEPGETILIALSGGPDSVALTHLLTRLRGTLDLSLTAVNIDHRIRKRAARAEARFCREFGESLQIPVETAERDIPVIAKREGKSIEECARDERYRVFDELADDIGAARIAVGHHADDQVETVLFRLFRGAGRSGLLGMPIIRGRIIRPLLACRRDEIIAYLEEFGLDYCEDASNRSTEYSRNFIRQALLPPIRERLNPQVDRAVLSTVELLADEERYLESQTEAAFRRTVSRTPGAKFQLDLSRYSRYDNVLRRRLLRRCYRHLTGRQEPPDRAVIDRFDRFCMGRGRALSLPGQFRAVRSEPDRVVLAPTGRISFSREIILGQRIRLEPTCLMVRARTIDAGQLREGRKRRSRSVAVDWECVSEPLVVRTIRPGDRFRPLGMKGRKKIGDYLTDRKIPPVLRDEIPVVCDRHGVIWLAGFEIDDRVKRTAATRKVLKIDISEVTTDAI
ncbi:tRNA lysidine(34) synthetase TilS [candidate division GN15 bacterium]|nr:tRNA lysidine(34) synthetase TilS [candidate division GN15 bacterium]